jgi:cytochrome c biogenesis protein CcmG/thiol:disulfide interchange protein DsbE
MNRRSLGIASISAIVILAVAGTLYVRFHASRELKNASIAPIVATAQMGQRAPQFNVLTTHGAFNLNKATKPVFVEIFATWCPHCQRETSVINRLYDTYHSRVDFVAIPGSTTGMDETSPESQLDVLNFQLRFHVHYPIAAYDPTLSVAKLYLQGGYPTIAVINTKKTIAYLNAGEVPYRQLAAVLNRVLKG